MTGHASFRTLKTIFPALYAGELRLLLVKISNDPTISVAMLHVVACALGTRGDVQPLSLLAWQLAHHISISTDQSPYCPDNRSRRVQVAFVTHAAHKPWLDQLHLAFVDDTAGRQLQFLFISTLPATAWHTAEGSNSRCAGDTRPEVRDCSMSNQMGCGVVFRCGVVAVTAAVAAAAAACCLQQRPCCTHQRQHLAWPQHAAVAAVVVQNTITCFLILTFAGCYKK